MRPFRLVPVVLLVAATAVSPVRAQGIPVFSAQDVPHYIAVLNAWADQIEQSIFIAEQTKRQADGLLGSRNLGQIRSNPIFRRMVPYEMQEMLRDLDKLGGKVLRNTARSVRDESFVFDACAGVTTGEAQMACEARAARPAVSVAIWRDIGEALNDRVGQLEELQAEINATEDPMATAQLQLRYDAELAGIGNTNTHVAAMENLLEAEERMAEQASRERQAEIWAQPPTHPQLEPMSLINRD